MPTPFYYNANVISSQPRRHKGRAEARAEALPMWPGEWAGFKNSLYNDYSKSNNYINQHLQTLIKHY